MKHLITTYLPYLLSTITIYQVFWQETKNVHAWIVGIGNQALWLIWILISQNYGLLPMNVAMWVLYTRNHFKWRKETSNFKKESQPIIHPTRELVVYPCGLYSISFRTYHARTDNSPMMECRLVSADDFRGCGQVKFATEEVSFDAMKQAYDLAQVDLQQTISKYCGPQKC
jgi:hypothetical protein